MLFCFVQITSRVQFASKVRPSRKQDVKLSMMNCYKKSTVPQNHPLYAGMYFSIFYNKNETSFTVPCKKTRDFAHFPYKLAIFEWGFWAIIALLFPWTPGSKQCEIGGFQKGTSCPCASRGCKVAGCQTFFIFQKLYFSFYVSYFHMKTAPPMNTFDFLKY